jgi:hypothetical protein
MPNIPTSSKLLPIDIPLDDEARKWHDILTQFRDRLQEIAESKIVRADTEAQRIIIGMVHCRNMVEVDAQMDRLAMRVGELLAAKTGDATELTRLISPTRANGRAALARHSKQHNFEPDDENGRPIRWVTKL